MQNNKIPATDNKHKTIYHFTKKEQWTKAVNDYKPLFFDKEGFIHCSKKHQIVQAANKFAKGQHNLVILCIDTQQVKAPIVYENTEGGQALFPHIYGTLNVSAVVRVVPFPVGSNGFFELPPQL